MAKTEVKLINLPITLVGHSHMFPKNQPFFLVKEVADLDEGTLTYHGWLHNELTGTCYEAQFNALTGEHLQFDGSAHSPYNVKIDVDWFTGL